MVIFNRIIEYIVAYLLQQGVIESDQKEIYTYGFYRGVMVCACLVATTVPVYAQTVNFNITVGKKSNPDPLSKRASKKDGEQKFYVTATAFDDIGSIRCTSKRVNGGVKSATITVKSSQVNKKKSGVYSAENAKAGEEYYMETTWNSGPSKLNVKGRYTP